MNSRVIFCIRKTCFATPNILVDSFSLSSIPWGSFYPKNNNIYYSSMSISHNERMKRFGPQRFRSRARESLSIPCYEKRKTFVRHEIPRTVLFRKRYMNYDLLFYNNPTPTNTFSGRLSLRSKVCGRRGLLLHSASS